MTHPLDYVGNLSPEAIGDIEKVRQAAKVLFEAVKQHAPDSREKSLALTKIEEAAMWANKAITHYERKTD